MTSNTDQLFRHCPASKLDEFTQMPTGDAFRLREIDGGCISINLAYLLSGSSVAEYLEDLRNTFARKGRKIGGRSKFALLEVGRLIHGVHLATNGDRTLSVNEDIEVGVDPSHGCIRGMSLSDSDQYFQYIADEVIDVFPGK